METKISKNYEKIENILVKKNVYKGYGLAHWNNFTIFIENAVVEDILDIKIEYKRAKSLFATIINIKKPSKFRTNKNECNVFGKCGGCDWLNIKYDAQLKIKQGIIKELYPNKSIEIQKSPQVNYYRNKSFFPVSLQNGKPTIGIFKKKSHEVIEHDKCMLIPNIFDEIIIAFKEYLIKSKAKIYDEISNKGNVKHLGLRINNSGQILVIIVTKTKKLPFTNLMIKTLTGKFPLITGIIQNINRKNSNRILGDEEKILFGEPFFEEILFKKRLKVNYNSFFQANFTVMQNMYLFIADNLKKDDIVIDAYSGTGTIGISVANSVDKVFCIENNEAAYKNSLENIKNNNILNCESYLGDVNDKISELFQKHSVSTVIFDPPRKGIGKESLELISTKKVKIIYVSCNPTTQKRDMEKLLDKGFAINSIKAFDMFPHTYHIETVIVLQKKGMNND